MNQLSQALDEVSYEWLMGQHPGLVTAIEREVILGATPARVKQFVLSHTQRLELALRCEQVARHLSRITQEEEAKTAGPELRY